MTKIAITGASGHFGRATAEALLAVVAAEDLILISRSPQKLQDLQEQGCVVRQGDFDDGYGLTEALRGADRVLMISGTRVGFREPQHRNAVEASVAAGVKHIIYTSFIGADASNPSMAVKDHIFTEKLMRASGVDFTFLRNAQYSDAVLDAMGPLAIASGRMTSVAGDGRMAFVCRDDCVAAAVAVLTGDAHEGKVYGISGPELLSYRDVCSLISEISGTPIDFELTDVDGLYAIFDALGVPRQPVDDLTVNNFPWNSDDMVSFEVAVRDGHFAILTDDVAKLTGHRPRSLRDLLISHKQELLERAGAVEGAG
ncbi:MAG: SDR family oxidoreductase [Sphingobium sp.]|nr:SDR family oxidoreductase [Sphingobium sp.]